MGRSWSIGTYFDIPVKIHWTFGFILIFIGYTGTSEGMSITEVLWFGFTVLSIFFCIVLHEYGHALMARYYKVGTKDIIISPIGGVARLERIPTIPKQELLIAIAGPLVNVVIGLVVALVFILCYGIQLDTSQLLQDTGQGFSSYLLLLIIINGGLFLFNLVPAFPMDGGRILRALISYKWGLSRATQIATIIARVIAVVFMLFGAYLFQPTWIAIGVFVFIMSGSENKQTQFNIKLESTTVAQIMTERDYNL